MRKIGTCPNGELSQNPAPGEDVVRDYWIAIVVRGTRTTQRLKERITRYWPGEPRAIFIQNCKAGVIPLDVLRRTDTTIRVRWNAGRNEAGDTSPNAFETDPCRIRG